jgi:hypothetical protein
LIIPLGRQRDRRMPLISISISGEAILETSIIVEAGGERRKYSRRTAWI